MRVLALRADSGGCAKYRIIEPVNELRNITDWDIRVEVDAAADAMENLNNGWVKVDEVKEDIDLLIIQRPTLQATNALARRAQEQGIAVIVELDDDLSALRPDHMSYKQAQPRHSPMDNYEWIYKTAEIADLVTVSTPALLKFAPHGRGVVLPNCIPDEVFSNPPVASLNTETGLGWAGSTGVHPGDLRVVGDAVRRVLRRHKQPFHVVGDGIGVRDDLALPKSIEMVGTGWVSLDRYYDALKNNISVGIVPLVDDEFTKSKSFLKGLEYASLGIPFVASGTHPEYKTLYEQGIGQLANTPDEWYRLLNRLLTNPKKAYMLGQKYRSLVEKKYKYSQHAPKWKNAWEIAVEHRKSL